MKKFFGGIFIEKEKLIEAGIEHPIKLEYYKIISEKEVCNYNKYGVNVVKTEYLENDIKVEENTVEYLTNNEHKINDILTILKENEVTPICIQDIICDLAKDLI